MQKRILFIAITLVSLLMLSQILDAQTAKRVTNKRFGATTKELLDKLSKYQRQKDFKAFEKLWESGAVLGAVTIFNVGEEVYVMETSWFLVKLRRKGETTEYWTYVEAIK